MSSNYNLSTTWLQNFRPSVDGEKVEDWPTFKLNLAAGAITTITLEYKYSSLIGTSQGVIAVDLQAAVPGLKILPPPGQLIEMATGTTELSWVITAPRDFSGPVVVFFRLPNYSVAGDSPPFPIQIFNLSWLTDFQLLVNEKEVSWAEAYLPVVERGTCRLTLKYPESPPPGSPEAHVLLDFAPEGKVDGLHADKPFGELVPMEVGRDSISWDLISDAKADSATFRLQFYMPKFPGMPVSQSLSGTILNDVWLREFTLFVNDELVGFDNIFLPVVEGGICKLTLNYEGSSLVGLRGAAVALQFKPGAGVDGLVSDRPLGELVPMAVGTKSISWNISSNPDARNSSFELQLSMSELPEVPLSQSLPGTVLNDVWRREFTLLVNDESVDVDNIYLPVVEGGICKLTLNYEGSSLVGLRGASVALQFSPGAGVDGLVSDKPLGELVPIAVGTNSISWKISSLPDASSAPFKLQLSMPEFIGMPASPPLEGHIYNAVWQREFTIRVNGEVQDWSAVNLLMAAGQSCTLTLDYEKSYLIGDSRSAVCLVPMPDEDLAGLVSDPPFGALLLLDEGTRSLSWTLSTDKASNGPFKLNFQMPLFYEGTPDSQPIAGTVIDFAKEVDVKFDFFAAAFDEGNAYPCHGAKHTLTVRPKPSSNFLNANVKLLLTGEGLGVVFRPSVVTEQRLTQEGATWELNCFNTVLNGSFSLQLAVVESGLTSLPLTMKLAHNWVSAEKWFTGPHYVWPDTDNPYYQIYIRATSIYLNVPASNVPVYYGNNPSSMFTNSAGQCNRRSNSNFLDLHILNLYNGTIV